MAKTYGRDQSALQAYLTQAKAPVYDPQYQTQPVGPGVGIQEATALTPAIAKGTDAPAVEGHSQATRDALGGYAGVGNLSGFRTDDYGGDVKARNSMKNTFGRIASRYVAAPNSLDAIFADADFQRYFPNARRVPGGAGDQIDFGGQLSDFESGTPVGIVDVGQAFDPTTNSGAAWTWQDLANDGDGSSGGGVGGLPPDLQAALSGIGGGGTFADIQKELDAIINGRPSPTNQRYLQSMLGEERI